MCCLFQVDNAIKANEELMHYVRPIQRSILRHGPPTVKSRRKQWVEEDMTMESADPTANEHNEQEVSHDNTTWN